MKSLSLDSNLNVLDIDSKLLRTARVTPVYKGKCDKRDRSNYRPVSVSGSICMIMKERITHKSYLTSSSII